jgi:hypothetical protein
VKLMTAPSPVACARCSSARNTAATSPRA